MSLREHLGELKKRLKVIAGAFVASLIFWLLLPAGAFDPTALFTGMYRPMVSIVLRNAEGLAAGRVTIISGSLTAPLEVYFLAGAVMSLLTSSPVIAYEIYKFVDPALKPNERSIISKFVTAFVALFAGGCAIGYFLLAPAIIRFMVFFAAVVGSQPIVTVGDYYGMVFMAVGATGLAFTTPSVFLLLVRFGIVSTTSFTKARWIIYLGLYVFIASLTPEPVVGHFGMFFPIVIMLEVSVYLGRRIERNRAREKGIDLPSGPRCQYCREPLEEGKRFCPSCGRAQA